MRPSPRVRESSLRSRVSPAGADTALSVCSERPCRPHGLDRWLPAGTFDVVVRALSADRGFERMTAASLGS
jgi:hypothetical protein